MTSRFTEQLAPKQVVLMVLLALLFSACEGDQGPPGSAGPGPTDEQVQAAVQAVLVGESADVASIARGGRLYNKWYAEVGADEPSTDHPLWATQSTNTRSGKDTWRCKECHGWDYKGAGGAYSSGSHFTGFPGVVRASAAMSKAELLDVMQGSTDYRHDFTTVMSEADLNDLVNFLAEGLINDTVFFDYNAAGIPPRTADASHGETLYGNTCSMCHGATGSQILIGGTDGLGTIARDEPTVEIVHIIRTGMPGTSMPASIVSDWSVQDAVDVLAYIQTLD